VTDNIYEKIGVNLHKKPAHPIGIIKDAIYSYFDRTYPGVFTKFDDLHPIVSAQAVSSNDCPSVMLLSFGTTTRADILFRDCRTLTKS
jgi:hypothetical protein